MLLDSNYAKIYDTVFFFLLYFNREHYRARFEPLCEPAGEQTGVEQNNPFESFESISKQLSDIPRLISPFFRLRGRHSGFMSFFERGVGCLKSDIEDFIRTIRSSSDLLYRSVVDSLFGDYEKRTGCRLSKDSPESLVAAVEASDGSDSDRLQLALMLGNFDFAVSELIDSLRRVYSEVSYLHWQRADAAAAKFEQIKSEPHPEMLEKILRLSSESLNDAVYSFSLLNPYVVMDSTADGRTLIILGLQYEQSFSDSRGDGDAAAKFVAVCGSRLRMKMLRGLALSENGEMTLSDFANYTDTQATTVIHNLRVLEEGNILTVSRREGKFIYYKANARFLAQVKSELDSLLDKLI